MTQAKAQIRVASDNDDLPTYPLATSDTLESHFYFEMHFRRWLNSRFCMLADPDVGFYGFNLFCIAQDQSPVGTLPCDDRLLAKHLNIDLERWQSLCKREVPPLFNWYRVRCDTGEIRWAHDFVTERAEKQLGSRIRNAQDAAKRRERKRLLDLKEKLEKIGASRLLANPGYVEALDAWLVENAGQRNRSETLVREAMDALATGPSFRG